MQIKIGVVDDHAIFRKAIAMTLGQFDKYRVVIEAEHGKDLLMKLNHLEDKERPDIILLDVNMPEMNGYETAGIITQKYPSIKILALSAYETEYGIINMLKNGACGYLVKTFSIDDLINAINSAYNNGYFHSDFLSSTITKSFNTKNFDLTKREIEFLKLCGSDHSYLQMSSELSVSPRTIDGLRESVFKKLGLNSRTALAIYAIKSGLCNISK